MHLLFWFLWAVSGCLAYGFAKGFKKEFYALVVALDNEIDEMNITRVWLMERLIHEGFGIIDTKDLLESNLERCRSWLHQVAGNSALHHSECGEDFLTLLDARLEAMKSRGALLIPKIGYRWTWFDEAALFALIPVGLASLLFIHAIGFILFDTSRRKAAWAWRMPKELWRK